jgi:branched-chain amino acid transport system substrate-binding protein
MAVLVSACLIAAGCGSSNKSTSAPGGGSTTAASGSKTSSGTGTGTGSASASKAPIRIFVYADVTVPPPTPPETFWQDIPQATVKAINAAGGINGAPIQMTFCDSKFDPNATLACVHQAISGHYAAVIVPTSSVGAGGADQLLSKSGLPIFYGIPGPTQFAAKNAVCATSTIIGSGNGVGWMSKSLGLKKLSLAEINSPTFVATGKIVKSSLSRVGVSAGPTVTTPIGTPDLSSDFAQAMNGGADGLWYANLPPILNSSIKQFLGSYPKKPLILQYVSYNTLQEVGAAGNGQLYFPAWTQPLASNVPGATQFEAAIKKYGSDPEADLNDAYLPAYLTVKLFAGIASTIKGQVTASSMDSAIKSASNVSLGGLIPNYSGAKLGTGGASCIYENAIVPEVDKNGTLVDMDGSSFLNTATGKKESAAG